MCTDRVTYQSYRGLCTIAAAVVTAAIVAAVTVTAAVVAAAIMSLTADPATVVNIRTTIYGFSHLYHCYSHIASYPEWDKKAKTGQ